MLLYLTHPAKSNCNSSLGSTTSSIWNDCCLPTTCFHFLPFTVHWRHPCAICAIERWMWGNQMFWQRYSMAAYPGWVRCRLPSTVFRSCEGRTMRSSINRQSTRTRNRFWLLYQCCPKNNLRASQSLFRRSLTAGAYFEVFGLRLQSSRAPKFCTFFL